MREEDERVYADFAEGLRQNFPATAAIFDGMREEESGHRRRLMELYREKFGEHIPLIRRQDVRGFVERKPIWLVQPLGLDAVRKEASAMEFETRQFYEKSAGRARKDAGIRQLLDDLAAVERSHETRAQELKETELRPDVQEEEDRARRRLFVLQIVQPGLAGLMDGSGLHSSLPSLPPHSLPHKSWDAFLVGLAASLGAGISMGFAEALSDDGSLTGRGHPWVRGVICGGAMTALGGSRPHLAISHSKLPCSDDCRLLCGSRGIGRDHLDSSSLHGHAYVFRGAAGWIGRSAGVCDGSTHRQLLVCSDALL